ncbi:IclR family transcriptional regulator [Eubacteriales bacterium OttesenSCG-928-A19]|nr:IclR family transcriptional regulator [Eubacteriales bacterium OttesenSCG-928-A19]
MERNASHVQSVERALRLIDLLAQEGREMSLTEISRAMEWPKSTVHGLLATLRDYQFVDQSPSTGHYYLGVRLFELGNQVARSWNIRTMAMPVMQRLNSRLGEMVQLATEDKGEVLYIEKIDSTQMFRIVSDIGVRLPMHCSGLGKVLLAFKTPAEVKYILSRKGQKAMTRRTITDPRELELELAKVREQGYAVDDREIMDSLRCIAAPIFDRECRVQYAISISGLPNVLSGDRFDTALEAVREAAEEISFAMGHRESMAK